MQETNVRAESSDVSSRFAAQPNDAELLFVVVLEELAFVDVSDSQLSFDGGDPDNSERTLGASERPLPSWTTGTLPAAARFQCPRAASPSRRTPSPPAAGTSPDALLC